MDGRASSDDRRSMGESAAVKDLTTLSERELAKLLTQLERDEQAVSRRRTKLHERIDFIRSGGFASAEPNEDPLEELLEEERDLSTRRNELHFRIDELRTEHIRRQRGRRS